MKNAIALLFPPCDSRGLFKTVFMLLILYCFFCGILKGQTFSNNTSSAHNSWNSSNAWATALTKNIVVSGLPSSLSVGGTVLKQINVRLGDGTNSGLNLSSYYMRLYHPNGTTFIELCSSGGKDCGGTSIRDVGVKYRDHSVLKSIGELPSGTPSAAWPYSIGYYRVSNASDFATFNSLNPNGTWALKIVENTSTEIAFAGVDLEFGNAVDIVDLSSSTTNDVCSGARCTDKTQVFIGTNNGYGNPGPSTDPAITVGSCSWNGSKNNSAWFYFVANGPTVGITISGLSAQLQSIGLNMSGSCSSPVYSVPSGGCPNDAVNNQYGGGATHGSSGMSYNHELNFSGLTSGNSYYVVVDGTGGAISPFYIELTGSLTSCSIILPIELLSFHAKHLDNHVVLDWSVAREFNNNYYTVERSANAIEWEVVGVQKGAGSSNGSINYEMLDYSFKNGINYYRLKQTDYNGNYTYSDILALEASSKKDFRVYPNPFDSKITIQTAGDDYIKNYVIKDVLGKKIEEGKLNEAETILEVSDLKQGTYFITINQTSTFKLIK